MMKMVEVYPDLFPKLEDVQAAFTDDTWKELIADGFTSKYEKMKDVSAMCDYHKTITEVEFKN